MALLNFLHVKNKVRAAAIFDHNTGLHQAAGQVVEQYCEKRGITLHHGKLHSTKPKKMSPEQFWREERYQFLEQVAVEYDTPESTCKIVTGHNLDDLAETWIMTSLNGGSKLIPRANGRVYRPFLHTPKSNLIAYCTINDIKWVDDPGNFDGKFKRSQVRNHLMPHILNVQPGFYEMVRRQSLKVGD